MKNLLTNYLRSTSCLADVSGELLQADSYSFGMTMDGKSYYNTTLDIDNKNLYLYNGKELQTDFDLDWYYYGARFYDPVIARFNTVDPKAEEFNFQSPYVYANNNPILFIDLNGENSWIPTINDNGDVVLIAEKGDNQKTLERFFQNSNMSKEQIGKLYNNRQSFKPSFPSSNPDDIVAGGGSPVGINLTEQLGGVYSQINISYNSDRTTQESHNCFSVYLNIGMGKNINTKGGNEMRLYDEGEWYYPDYHSGSNQADGILTKNFKDANSNLIPGKTILRFSNDNRSYFGYTGHYAISMGESRAGVEYAITKNGASRISIMRVSEISKKYGKVTGVRSNESGYYNLNNK